MVIFGILHIGMQEMSDTLSEPKRLRITIDRDSSKPTYQQLCDQIVKAIQSDKFQIGEFLPTENEVCELTGLSRMTVRKALDKLNHLGLVEAVRGRGTFIVAKEPSTKIKRSIGFVLRPHRYIEEDPFYSHILMGVTQEAQKQRLHLAFISGEHVESHDVENHPYQFLSHLSGAIIAGQMPNAFLDYVQKIHLPCVFLNYRSSAYPFDAVTADQLEVGRLQGKHLAELGHNQCLYISGESDNVAYEDRLAGFMETFTGDSTRKVVVLKGRKNSESGREMVQQALEQKTPFTAIAAGNDRMAIGAMNELLDRGFRIPEEISVCGIDNIPFTENCRPALTTVHIEKQEMGIKAVQLLLERLKNPAKIQETILLGIELRVRHSTGPAANGTPPSRRASRKKNR